MIQLVVRARDQLIGSAPQHIRLRRTCFVASANPDLPTKLAIANEFKAFVKKNSVPRDLIHAYFLTLSRAIKSREDTQLTSVCFSCFCHLFKRVSIQDKLLLDDSATVAVVTDLLIDRLSDRSTGVRATANKVLLDYWVLVPQAVAVAMRQKGVVSSSHVTLGESLKWLQSVFDLSSAFNFSAFVQPVVDMLRYPQLQAPVCDLLKNVYSVSDTRELEECLAVSSAQEVLKKDILKSVGVQTLNPVKVQHPKTLNPQKELPKAEPKEEIQGKENVPSDNQLSFLDALQGYKLDTLAPENVYSLGDLENKFQNMHAGFADKESEKNWSLREKHVTQIRKLMRGNGPKEYPSQFAAAYKAVIDGVLKSATSLRTTLSNQGLLVIKESGQLGGPLLVDHVIDTIFPQILKLTGQMKKITSNKAHVTICALLTSASFSTKLISHVTAATTEKNAQPRAFAAVWYRIIIASHSQTHKSAFQNHGGLEQLEKGILKLLADATPAVKENSRVTYWSFAHFWPMEGERIYSKLDPKARGLLDKVNPEGSHVTKKAPPRESIKDAIRRSRESSGGVSRDQQRTKMGAPQRASSGLVGRSLSGSQVTTGARTSRDLSESRDQRSVSDTSRPGMTRSVSGRLTREPSQTRLSRDQSQTRVSRDQSQTRLSRDPSLPRELPRQRVDTGRPRVASVSRDRFGQRQVSTQSRDTQKSRDSSLARSRDSSRAPSIESVTIPSRESSAAREDVDMDDHVAEKDHMTKSEHVTQPDHVTEPEPDASMEDAPVEATPAMDIPSRDTPTKSRDTPSPHVTPPGSSPFVMAKSPATQGFSMSPATGKSASPVDTAEHVSRELVESRDVEDEARDVSMEPRDGESRDVEDEANGALADAQAPGEPGKAPAESESRDQAPDSPHHADSAFSTLAESVQSRDLPPRDTPTPPPMIQSDAPILSPQPVKPSRLDLESRDEESRDLEDAARDQNESHDTESRDMDVDVPEPEAVAEVETAVPSIVVADVSTHNMEDNAGHVTETAESDPPGSTDFVTEAVQEDPFGPVLTKEEVVESRDSELPAESAESRDVDVAESALPEPAESHDPTVDESEPMEMCESDNDVQESREAEATAESASPDFASRDLKNELNTFPPSGVSLLLSNPEHYENILSHVPAELFLLCVILFAESHVTYAQELLSRDTHLSLSTASSMVMVCARDVYPGGSRWSRASVEELKHVTVTCLEWLTKLVAESAEASTLLATNKRYRTSLVHLLSTSVELHKQKFGHVTHEALIHVISAMDKLSQRPPDKRTSRAFMEAPSPDSSTVEDVTQKLSHVRVTPLTSVRVLPGDVKESQVTWSKLELERLARSPISADSTEAILDLVSRDKVSVTQLATLASRVSELDDVDHVTATVLAYLHITHPPALTCAALVVVKKVLTKPGLVLSMGHVTEIYTTLNHVTGRVDSRAPLAAGIEELVADLLGHADSAELLEFLLVSRSRDSKTPHKLLLLNTVYHVISSDNMPSHETQLLALVSEYISDPDPLVRRVTVGLVVRILRLSPDMEGTVSLAIKGKMALVKYYMGE